MPNIKLTRERLAAIRALRQCRPPIALKVIGKIFGMHHSSVCNALRGKNKIEYPGASDRLNIAGQLREIARRIESGEISIN